MRWLVDLLLNPGSLILRLLFSSLCDGLSVTLVGSMGLWMQVRQEHGVGPPCIVTYYAACSTCAHLFTLFTMRTTAGHDDEVPLLALLAKLKQLRVLGLCNMSAQWPAPSEAYAGITASSKLQRLDLRSCWVPHGVWQHVSPCRTQAARPSQVRDSGALAGLVCVQHSTCQLGSGIYAHAIMAGELHVP